MARGEADPRKGPGGRTNACDVGRLGRTPRPAVPGCEYPIWAGADGMTRDEFFDWCAKRGLADNTPISAVFCVSSQTVRNWRRREGGDDLPAWVPLACEGYDALTDGEGGLPRLPMVTVGWLAEWQHRHGLRTYDDTASVFDLTRQAVHNWFKRGRFPRWLALACAGHDARIHLSGGDPVDGRSGG